MSSTIELSTMPVEDSYKGPCMKGSDKEGYTLDLEFVKAMLDEFKEQRLVHRWGRGRLTRQWGTGDGVEEWALVRRLWLGDHRAAAGLGCKGEFLSRVGRARRCGHAFNSPCSP